MSLGSRMGQGSGGVIYHAKWRGLDVVAKMLRPEGERDGNIKREVETLYMYIYTYIT